MSKPTTPYEAIGSDLDERLSKDRRVIEWIKSQLFDVLTLWENWDQEARKEICNNIIANLEAKKEN